MSLGFEVEINVQVKCLGEYGQLGSFPSGYKGVTLFRTVEKPGVCAVIETGNTGMSSTVELVSHVDKDPYTYPIWQRQLVQLVTLASQLAESRNESVDHFVNSTLDAYRFDEDLTEEDVARELGGATRSWWEKYLCCFCYPVDTRVTSLRDARLTTTGAQFAGDGGVQINFSSNLDYIGTRLAQNAHPFADLVDGTHTVLEKELVARLTKASCLSQLFGDVNVDLEVLAYVYLILHRISFEQGKDLTKNRFLFLHRFNFADLRLLLSDEQLQQIARVPRNAILQLAHNHQHAQVLTEKDCFSRAAAMHHKNLGDRGVQNTLREFLDAVLLDEYHDVPRDTLSSCILRVADSTIPARVSDADNIVFEGRLPSWYQFIPQKYVNVDVDSTDKATYRKVLRSALKNMGNTVVGYDRAPVKRPSIVRNQQRAVSTKGLSIKSKERVPLEEGEGLLSTGSSDLVLLEEF